MPKKATDKKVQISSYVPNYDEISYIVSEDGDSINGDTLNKLLCEKYIASSFILQDYILTLYKDGLSITEKKEALAKLVSYLFANYPTYQLRSIVEIIIKMLAYEDFMESGGDEPLAYDPAVEARARHLEGIAEVLKGYVRSCDIADQFIQNHGDTLNVSHLKPWELRLPVGYPITKEIYDDREKLKQEAEDYLVFLPFAKPEEILKQLLLYWDYMHDKPKTDDLIMCVIWTAEDIRVDGTSRNQLRLAVRNLKESD